jgi:LysM domain
VVALKWSEVPGRPPKYSCGREQAQVRAGSVAANQQEARPRHSTSALSVGAESPGLVAPDRPASLHRPSVHGGAGATSRGPVRSRRAAMRARRKFLWRRALVVLAIACSGAVAWDIGSRVVAIAGAEPSPAGQRIYTVRPGDTIWSIAVRSARGGDPWRIVNRLETEIGGGVLQPGDRLVLP